MRNNKSILKTQERIKFERYNIFTQGINKINLSSNSDKKKAINWFDRNICIWNEETRN